MTPPSPRPRTRTARRRRHARRDEVDDILQTLIHPRLLALAVVPATARRASQTRVMSSSMSRAARWRACVVNARESAEVSHRRRARHDEDALA